MRSRTWRGDRDCTELDVTRRAMAAARQAVESAGIGTTQSGRRQDPGYYLIADGREAFEQDLGFRVPVAEWLVRAITRAGITGYVAAIAFIVALAVALPLLALSEFGSSGIVGFDGWPLVRLTLLALLALIPASELAVAVINRAVMHDVRPRPLPGLELRDGVPAALRTLIVVPTFLATRATVDEQIERLQIHYLASQDGDLRFALLSDWTDAPTEMAPGDDELLHAAADGIARLNRQVRRGLGRSTVPAPAPPADLERRGRLLDRLGAQAGKAARAESMAAWRDRHDLRAHRRPGPRGSRRRPLRHHPGRRHAPATQCGQASGRQDGASAEPPAARSRPRPGRRRVRRPAAARHPFAAVAPGRVALPACVHESQRPGPVRVRGLRRVPGPVR